MSKTGVYKGWLLAQYTVYVELVFFLSSILSKHCNILGLLTHFKPKNGLLGSCFSKNKKKLMSELDYSKDWMLKR